MKARLRMLAAVDRPEYSCLRCGHVFDRASGVGSDPIAEPKPGSLSLCIRCGDPAIFIDGGPGLRPLTDAERADIDADPEIGRIRRALAQSIAERPS